MGNQTATPPADDGRLERSPPESRFSGVRRGKSHQIQSSFCSTSIIVKISAISVIIQEKTLILQIIRVLTS
jgi:hypothetical protein